MSHEAFQCNSRAPQQAGTQLVYVYNTGLNPVRLHPIVQNVTWPCSSLLPANVTDLKVNISANASAVLASYHSTQSFSYHPLVSPANASFAFPVGEISIPYPRNGSMLCDSDADCPGAAGTCETQKQPHMCKDPTPKPPPPPKPQPTPAPVPVPTASQCNISGWYKQSGSQIQPPPLRWQHSSQAFVNITMDKPRSSSLPSVLSGDATFSWVCTSDKGECLGLLSSTNGTGTLSSTSNQMTVRTFNGSEFQAVVNDTVNCGPLVLTSVRPDPSKPPASWTRDGPPAPRRWDLEVDTATFLGDGAAGSEGRNLAVEVAVDILPSGHVVVATNGQFKLGNKDAAPLLPGANASSNGTIAVLDVPHNAKARAAAGLEIGSGSGVIGSSAPTVVARYALGGRVDHLRCNNKGECAVAGSFGVAVLAMMGEAEGSEGSLGASPKVLWQDTLQDVRPSECGVCCSTTEGLGHDSPPNCRVDIDDEGVVGASLGGLGNDFLWTVYAAGSGHRTAGGSMRQSSLTDVQLQPQHKRLLVSSFYDSNTGHEPMVMASIRGFAYEGGDEVIKAYDYDAHVYREEGPCDGRVADGRAVSLRRSEDGKGLAFLGRSDGGDDMFYCQSRDVLRTSARLSFDAYTSAYNMQAQAITYAASMDPDTLQVEKGELQLVRLSSSGGNTLRPKQAAMDANGVTYILHDASCCMPDMANKTINGKPLAGSSDATSFMALHPNFRDRLHWTHFTPAGGKGSQFAVDVSTRGGRVALLAASDGPMVQADEIKGTSAPDSSKPGAPTVGYLVVLPAPAIH